MVISAILTKQQILDFIKGSKSHPLDSFLEKGYAALDYGILTPTGEIIEQSEDYIDFCSRLSCSLSLKTAKYKEKVAQEIFNDYPILELNV